MCRTSEGEFSNMTNDWQKQWSIMYSIWLYIILGWKSVPAVSAVARGERLWLKLHEPAEHIAKALGLTGRATQWWPRVPTGFAAVSVAVVVAVVVLFYCPTKLPGYPRSSCPLNSSESTNQVHDVKTHCDIPSCSSVRYAPVLCAVTTTLARSSSLSQRFFSVCSLHCV